MTDKELIQALRCNEGTCWECDLCNDCFSLDEKVADRLEALIAEIERLPEPLVRVVGIVKDNPFSQYVPEVVHLDRNGWVFSYARRYVTDVTHWMPLPEPPSTEGVE